MNSTGEMIFTGDELLRGDAINTNQAYLGEKLLDLGILATHALCVADDRQAIVAAIRESLARRPVVLILSGGLGPTEDDLTREAAAEALDRPLEHHESLLEADPGTFRFPRLRDGREQSQAGLAAAGRLPHSHLGHRARLHRAARRHPGGGPAGGALGAEGDVGRAPWSLCCARTRAGSSGHAVRRIRTFGIGESMAAEMLSEFEWRGSEVEIGTRAQLDGLTIILRGTASPEGIEKLDATQARICAILGDRVFGVDSEGLPEITGGLLRQAGLTVAVAESCTGGLVAKRFTDVPGSSDYFVGGVTAYSNDVKTRILGVPARLLATHGAVSNEVAAAMAEGVRGLLCTDCSLSTTGIAGPGGGSEEKPVGLVFIGSVVRGITQVERLRLFGRRDQVRERAALAAVDLLRRRLLAEPG